VLFISSTNGLVPGDSNGGSNVFLRDRQTGTTEQIDVASDGTPSNGAANATGTVSADGRYVAFSSAGSNLDSPDTNGTTISLFIRDRVAQTTKLFNLNSAGTQISNAGGTPSISNDGQYAFWSTNQAGVPADTNGVVDVYRRDLVNNTTILVSANLAGTNGGNGHSTNTGSISADGRYVMFYSGASNLVASDTNSQTDSFVRDTQTNTTELVSVATDGTQATSGASDGTISGDGNWMAFSTYASTLVANDTNGTGDVFLRHRVNGTTERVSIGVNGEATGGASSTPALSHDGSRVSFVSSATNLVDGDTNGWGDAFVRDRTAGTTYRVSQGRGGVQANSSVYNVAISADGSTAALATPASNLLPNDSNGNADLFVAGPERPLNTVLPAITGSAQRGATLTVSNGTWDADPTSYAYQWRRCDTAGNNCADISGATSSTYVLTDGDAGSTIRVIVTATDSNGAASSISTASAVVLPLPPGNSQAPSITGTARDGQTLTAGNGTWTRTPASYAYQWRRCDAAGANCADISGETGSTYTLAAADIGSTIRVVVTATNAGGSTPQASAATATVVPIAPSNSVIPAVTGTTQEGETLTAGNGTWSSNPSSFAYQWRRCDSQGGNCADISGATSSTYALTSADVEATIRVRVTATNAGGSDVAESAATAAILPAVPVNSVAPAISGTAQEGETLTASNGTWSPAATSYTYQWQRCDGAGANCVSIAGATSQTYEPTGQDVDATLKVRVTATNSGGSQSGTSPATVAVLPAAPTGSAAPSMTGTVQQGETLTAGNGTWAGSPSSFAYQWQRCDAQSANCTDITGATAQTYTLTGDDVAGTVRVRVTATNPGGSNTAVSQTTVAVLVAAPVVSTPPSVTGTAQQGEPLGADHGTWSPAPASYAFQWLRCDAQGASCNPISGATANTYTPVAGDIDSTIRLRVTATNAGGSNTTTSAATAVMTPPIPLRPPSPRSAASPSRVRPSPAATASGRAARPPTATSGCAATTRAPTATRSRGPRRRRTPRRATTSGTWSSCG
jgi:hypothetical protein